MKITALIIGRVFKKQFKKLSKDVRIAFDERSDIFLNEPAHTLLNNHPLHGDRQDYWSINVTGSIRAIYKLQGTTAIFTEIGTHSELYGE